MHNYRPPGPEMLVSMYREAPSIRDHLRSIGCTCDAVVTTKPDRDHPQIVHLQAAHDDDCAFYRSLHAKDN